MMRRGRGKLGKKARDLWTWELAESLVMYRIFCSSSSVSLCAHYIDHGARPRIFETRTKTKEEEKKGLTKNMWKLYSRNRMMTIHSQMGRWKRARLLYSAFALSVILPGRYGIISSDPWTVSPTATDTFVRTFKRIHQPVSHAGHNVTWTFFATFFYYYSAYWKSFFFFKG